MNLKLAKTDTFSLFNDTYCVMEILSPNNSDTEEGDKYFYMLESCFGNGHEIAMRVEAGSLDQALDDYQTVESGKSLDVREVWAA